MNNNNELWKDVPGYEGIYQVSDHGRVKTLRTFRLIKSNDNILCVTITNNRRKVSLFKEGKTRKFSIYKLVAIAFLPNILNLPLVNHIDGDSTNDRLSNLEWSTYSKNNKHAYTLGRTNPMQGKTNELHHASKPIECKIGSTVLVFPSRKEASRSLNISFGNILRVINGKRRQAGGYTFKYLQSC